MPGELSINMGLTIGVVLNNLSEVGVVDIVGLYCENELFELGLLIAQVRGVDLF